MPEAAKQHAIADIDTALRKDRLQHRIAERVPLDQIAIANEVIEEGSARGAVILAID
jgi:NADPH:quinone reductase-like Zn-dependent oxidoreductase